MVITGRSMKRKKITMKREHPKTGIISSALALTPLVGFLIIFLVNVGSKNKINQAGNIVFSITILASPIAGLLLGIISLFKKNNRLIFPILGTTLNFGWIVLLIWGYFEMMKIVYR